MKTDTTCFYCQEKVDATYCRINFAGKTTCNRCMYFGKDVQHQHKTETKTKEQ